MGFYEDVRDQLANGIEYQSFHMVSEPNQVPMTMVSCEVPDCASVQSLKPATGLTTNEDDILLTTGQIVSTYASEGELCVVSLTDDGNAWCWVHAFKYTSLADLNVGLSLMLPPAEMRV